MDTVQPNLESHERVLAGAQVLYPAPPLSWLAPLWSYTCGVIASSGADWTGDSLLRFLLGLLLVGPLLGTAWRASEQIRPDRGLVTDPRGAADTPRRLGAWIPYTLPDSPGEHFVSWLRATSAWSHQGAPESGTLLLQLAGSIVFSLTVAAALGQRALALAAAALVCVCICGLVWQRRHVEPSASGGEGGTSAMAVFLSIFLAWLIGHAAFAAIRPESALVGACFALVICACFQIRRSGRSLLHLLLPQGIVIVYFVSIGQPVAAAGVTLLASAALLWAPLLEESVGRAAYFGAIQLPLAISMFLSAWTLGHGP